MARDVFAAAADLRRRGEPFVLATVVWSRGPSSGKQGSKAIVHPDGRVVGWLGGACAEPSLVDEARRALGDGRPRLMLLGSADEIERGRREDVAVVPMACESEGALEVYLEPMLPEPQVVVVGRSPAVDTLAQLTQTLGWRVVVVDHGGSAEQHPEVDAVVTGLDDLLDLGIDERSFVVVATQGHYDDLALERALETTAGYVGLVASRKRADRVLELLRSRGVPDERLARIRAPAGLDLGNVRHEEMAVAILAELVAARASGAVADGLRVESPAQAVDPVCGMTVAVATAHYTTEQGGATYYFCAAGCRQAFETNPSEFLG
jgi:xanthine dehydrogenase accessory factor